MVDPMSPTPLYVQVADAIEARIKSGELAPGHPIPSETQLRGEFGVARGTVRQAVALLRDRGLVVTARKGSFVTGE